MNHEIAKVQFRTGEEAGLDAQAVQRVQPPPLEFATVEDMLRYDAAQTPVPPELAERVNRSLAGEETAPKPSWFQRLLGGS